MGRIVEPERRVLDEQGVAGAPAPRARARGGAVADRVIQGGDRYWTRVAKYVPVEAIALYIVAQKGVETAQTQGFAIASEPWAAYIPVALAALFTMIHAFSNGVFQKVPWKTFMAASVGNLIVWIQAIDPELIQRFMTYPPVQGFLDAYPILEAALIPIAAALLGFARPVERQGVEQSVAVGPGEPGVVG